jgi:hypothetical protein
MKYTSERREPRGKWTGRPSRVVIASMAVFFASACAAGRARHAHPSTVLEARRHDGAIPSAASSAPRARSPLVAARTAFERSPCAAAPVAARAVRRCSRRARYSWQDCPAQRPPCAAPEPGGASTLPRWLPCCSRRCRCCCFCCCCCSSARGGAGFRPAAAGGHWRMLPFESRCASQAGSAVRRPERAARLAGAGRALASAQPRARRECRTSSFARSPEWLSAGRRLASRRRGFASAAASRLALLGRRCRRRVTHEPRLQDDATWPGTIGSWRLVTRPRVRRAVRGVRWSPPVCRSSFGGPGVSVVDHSPFSRVVLRVQHRRVVRLYGIV